jgi:hypothetical protein
MGFMAFYVLWRMVEPEVCSVAFALRLALDGKLIPRYACPRYDSELV